MSVHGFGCIMIVVTLFCGFGGFSDRESRFLYASVNAQRSGDHTMVVDGDGRVVFDG